MYKLYKINMQNITVTNRADKKRKNITVINKKDDKSSLTLEEIEKINKEMMRKIEEIKAEYNIVAIKKIYKIICEGIEECYVGSTGQELTERLYHHVWDYEAWKRGKKNYVSSFVMFEKYGVENCKIVLIEEVNNLPNIYLEREQYWMDNLKSVNEKNTYGDYKFISRGENIIKYNGSAKKEHVNMQIRQYLNTVCGKETVDETFSQDHIFLSNYNKLHEVIESRRIKILEKKQKKIAKRLEIRK